MHRGFGILQAIMIIVLLAGLLTIMLKYAAIGAKHTEDSYLREQTELFLQSSIEKALLDISATDRHQSCWKKGYYSYDDGRGKIYQASVVAEQYYLYGGSDGNCTGIDIQTPESHGYVRLFVEANLSVGGKLKIRLIRRSLQRP